jgi:predicted membrane-bound dolichyl-phosphate-mannose-protein mannosyltransferase
MSTSVRAGYVPTDAEGTGSSLAVWQPLLAILAVGFMLRLVFINADGFHNDVSAFEAWAITLSQQGPGKFYAASSFADYPPGYFYVLWFLGSIWQLFGTAHDPTYAILRILVKLPAIFADLGDAALIFVLVRRYAPLRWAYIAAGAFALNPTAIFVSAYWGQIDSFAAAALLGALLLLVIGATRSDRVGTVAVVCAWVAFAAGILVKPQGLVLVALMIAYPFATGSAVERARRLQATGLGVVAAFVLAWLATLPFHPTASVVDSFSWLYQRYAFGSGVYKYTSVNAFDLYAVKNAFWQPDDVPLTIGSLSLGPPYLWGIVLTLSATVLIAVRYATLRTERALLEGAMLVCLGFFVLSTRMHERYIFNAFILTMPLLAFGRRYIAAAVILTLTLFANLAYSLKYQNVMETHAAGVDATNIWPLVSHPAALLNVAVFFVLGYLYLGGESFGIERVLQSGATTRVGDAVTSTGIRVRAWFNPVEGIATFSRLDWFLSSGFVLLSFLICAAYYWLPNEKIFDEIYYARAGEEYLNGTDINRMGVFEFTHPPFTKLLVTLSMMLFGGLHSAHGDDAYGWRFLNVVVGAIMVGLTYVFAKRITSSTIFASLAALMMTFDGFHYVQSRIATPEITVAALSLAVLYAFYRFWTASAVHVRERIPGRFGRLFWIVMGVGTIVACGLSWLTNHIGHREWLDGVNGNTFIAYQTAFVYYEILVYLVARVVVPRFLPKAGSETAYADGSLVVAAESSLSITMPDGLSSGDLRASRTKKTDRIVAERHDGEAVARYANDGTMTYETPEGSAVFSPAGTMTANGIVVKPGDARTWLIITALIGGLLGASKWNGLFDFFVIWGVMAIVLGQRYLRKPALYGNPNGIPVDIVACTMLGIGGVIYMLAYIPFFMQRHDFSDLLGLQWQMYHYHSTLVATHPYSSVWWQWPILAKPISYYYHDFRAAVDAANPNACCVAEILALPNPLVWWSGLVTVPLVGWFAYTERNRAYALLVIAYFIQWLPWILSPRLSFEYHFFPNLALIVICNAIILQRIWILGERDLVPALKEKILGQSVSRLIVYAYAIATVGLFVFFLPVLAGVHVTWNDWHARMWQDHWVI